MGRDLYRSVRAAEILVAVHSWDFRRSRWCLAETALAQSSGTTVVPELVDGAPLDDNLTHLQAIDCSAVDFGALAEYSAFCSSSAKSLRTGTGRVRPFHPLEPEDAAVFFGREPDQDAVLEALERQEYGQRLSALLVHGGSGVGKSSFVYAGIVPALCRRPAQWLVTSTLRRYSRPVHDYSRR